MTQEHAKFQVLGDTAAGLLAVAKELQAHIDGAAHHLAQQELQQKATEVIGRIDGTSAERLASDPPAQDVPPEMLHNRNVQAQCSAAVEELERLHTSTGQLLQSARGALEGVQKAHGTWQHMLTAQSNRWHNQHGSTSPLLLLPPGVLHVVTHLAGRHTRLVCTALHHAYGPPAASLHFDRSRLEESKDYPLYTCAEDVALYVTYKLGPVVRRWPWPAAVTSVEVDWELSPEDFRAIAETFPQMQRLKLTVADTQPWDALPPGLTRLDIDFAGDFYRAAKVDLESITHLSALQHLSVECDNILPCGWAPLSCLTALTSLSLAKDHESDSYTNGAYMDIGDEDGEDSSDWSDGLSSRFEPLAIWQALAALPALKEVHLNKFIDWHSRMPERVGQLAATHLFLRCSSQMMVSASIQGEAPVLQVLRLLPALSSLTLWRSDQLLGSRMVDPGLQSRVLQALQGLPLQRLFLDHKAPSMSFARGLRAHLPSLTSLQLPGRTYQANGVDSWSAARP